ncbi:DUF2884 family protein [Aestuariibacter salexigens]|uniref:DUF2884 family protein n=1 Tax=Aestuariibacter salexigens TaxID=226010 RepID=UPI001F0AC882|nr:DUF2884 family protein [Aestuariibacter salexigens]
MADLKCDVDLHYGMVVTRDHIRVLEESRTLYQINDKKQLFVQGNLLELEKQQQALLKEFAGGLHYVVPKMTVLATEGVALATDTIEQVYIGLVGQDHGSYEKIQRAMDNVKSRVDKKFIYSKKNYYIGPGSLEHVDDMVDKEIEAQLEQAINTSVGGILSAISGVASSSDASDERVAELSKRLEEMELQLEQEVAPKAESLRQKANWFCNKLQRLDEIEESLRQSVPELYAYNIIYSGGVKQYKK